MELCSQPLESTYWFGKCREAVRDAGPIEEIARRYTELEPLGKGWFDGSCPLPGHSDPEPCFYIFPPGRWWCFECDCGGDAIALELLCGNYNELRGAVIALASEYGVELPRRPEKWQRWQQTKRGIHAAAEEVRDVVRRERLFKLLVLSGPEFEIEDPKERRATVERAWKVWESKLRRVGQ